MHTLSAMSAELDSAELAAQLAEDAAGRLLRYARIDTQSDEAGAVVMGGDGGFLSVVGGPGIRSFADLKGKTLSVDAMTTGLAFVLRELVARAGLSEADVTYVRAGGTPLRYRDLVAGKHDATLLRTPFELLARERGFTVLATAESLGAYQGSVAAVRRSWAKQNEAALVGFLRAYRQAVAWVYDPANREKAIEIVANFMKSSKDVLATYFLLPGKDYYRDRNGCVSVSALQKPIDAMIENQLISERVDASKYIKMQFLPRPCST